MTKQQLRLGDIVKLRSGHKLKVFYLNNKLMLYGKNKVLNGDSINNDLTGWIRLADIIKVYEQKSDLDLLNLKTGRLVWSRNKSYSTNYILSITAA